MAAPSDKSDVQLTTDAYVKASKARQAVAKAQERVTKADATFARKVNGLTEAQVEKELKPAIAQYHKDQEVETPVDTATQDVIEIQ